MACSGQDDEHFNACLEFAIGRITGLQGGRLAVPFLVSALREGKQEERELAVTALVEIGPSGEGAVPALVDALKSQSDYSLMARIALGRIGPKASPAVPILLRDLEFWDPMVRVYSASSLCRIQQDEDTLQLCLQTLTDILTDDSIDSLYRTAAAQEIGSLGPRARSCAPVLASTLAEREEELRAAAEQALLEVQD